MNTSHRTLWNAALASWVAVPETASWYRRGRSRSRGVVSAMRTTLIAAALSLAWAMPAVADTLHWDINGAAPGLGGSGAWNTSSNFWNTSATGTGGTATTWTNAPLNDAVFDGTAGVAAVTLGVPVTARNLTFGALPTYTLNGGTLTLAAGSTITANGNTSINSNVVGNVAVTGPGTVTLGTNGAISYTGTTTLSNGATLRLTSATVAARVRSTQFFVNGASTLIFQAQNRIDINGRIAFDSTGGGTVDLAGSNAFGGVVMGPGAMTVTTTGGAQNRLISTGAGFNLNAGVLTLDTTVATDNLLVSSLLWNQGSVTKTGPGTATLTAANSYGGITRLNGGVLSVSDVSNGGVNSSIGASTLAATNLVINGGTLRYTGVGQSTNRLFTLGAGGGTLDASGTGALNFTNGGAIVLPGAGARSLTLTGSNTGANTLAAVVGDGGGPSTVIKSGTGTWSLTGANTYSGGTTINSGTLSVSQDANLGASGGGIVLNGGTLQATATVGTSRVIVFNGAGTIDTAPAIVLSKSGGSSGAGSLNKTGTGTLLLTGINAYTGGTTITAGTLQLGNGGTAGSIVGDVTNNATLLVNRSDDSTLAGDIGGSGNLQKLGAGTLTLSGTNSYGGGTALLKGRIDVGSNSALGTGALAMSDGTTLGFAADGLTIANPVLLTGTFDPIVDTGAFTETLSGAITGGGILTKNGSGTLIVSGANTYTGPTNVAQGTLRGGVANTFSGASAHSVAAGATLDTGGFNQRVASLSNSGTVSLLSAAPGSTLTVNGAYAGNGGVLRLGTALAGSGSLSDRLVLDGAGASATGNTTVQVTNLGGLGALTTGNGINLISALNGATTTAQTTKNAFALAGSHVDAGAFEYRLFAGDAAGAGENWYLRSTSTVPVVPVTPTTPVTPSTPVTPTIPTATLPTYRAEVPMYAALPEVLRQSDLEMLSNLHRRVGDEGRPIDAAAGWGGAHRRVWARGLGGATTVAQDGTTAPESRISMAGLQAGVDMFANDTWNAGVYAGQLRSDARVSGTYGLNLFTAAYAGSLRADSMYLGGYATYANPQGQYADFVLQYGRHDITGTAAGRGAVDTDATSLTASAELGQRFALGSHWGIEPQVQLIYNRQRMDRAQISGANVLQDPAHALIGRVGVRVTGDFMIGAGRLQPYARLNLWHGFKGTDRTSFIGPAGAATIGNGIGYTSTELAAGFTLALTQSTSVYGEAGKLFHTGGGQAQVKSSVQGALGVRVRF